MAGRGGLGWRGWVRVSDLLRYLRLVTSDCITVVCASTRNGNRSIQTGRQMIAEVLAAGPGSYRMGLGLSSTPVRPRVSTHSAPLWA